MGNVCRGQKRKDIESQDERPRPRDKDPPVAKPSPELMNLTFDEILHHVKEHNKTRLKKELKNDPHSFVLDNLLLCIQFFDNFEESVRAAEKFKFRKETEMTEQLNKDTKEGMILGDRRIKLLTGMSHVLARNYIYRGKSNRDDDEAIDMYYTGADTKDTFMTDGILPLEFTISWDNLELHDVSEWHSLKHYSEANGTSPIARFCMEQPDKRYEFPKGYVRLRCVDGPTGHKQLTGPYNGGGTDYDYAADTIYPKSQTYGVSTSESEVTSIHSEDGSDEDEQLSKLPERLKNAGGFPFPSKGKMLHTIGEESNMPSTSKSSSRNERLTKSKGNLGKLTMPESKTDNFLKAINKPNVVLSEPTPPLHPRTHQLQQLKNISLLLPDSGLGRDSPGKDSSGYDTSSTRSRAGSERRTKWQKYNFKKLYEYGKKSRKGLIVGSENYDPMPPDCYSPVQYKDSYEFPENNEDESDDKETEEEDEDSNEDLGYGTELPSELRRKRKTKKKTTHEDEYEYEMRYYLNSLQVSSNSCSEFQYLGHRMNIPALSLANAEVLGATIRCSMPYTNPKTVDDNYNVTYTFTPSLSCQTWPQHFYLHFNQQIHLHSDNKQTVEEMWPSQAQMEQIEKHGCNAIPLGYRSTEFFNAEQILEWELNFQESEVNLLNSFKSPHWRAYIFAATLFRAFIVPLGPQGISLEHIRNVIYFMCHENFFAWNEEQPGLHLKILLQKLFENLSRHKMPSFFVRSSDLLKSVPQQSLRIVQGHLSRIRENLIIYCIYAFRNVADIRSKSSYSLPNLKKLYKILTVREPEILMMVNKNLPGTEDENEEVLQSTAEVTKQLRSSRRKSKTSLSEQQDEVSKDEELSNPEEMDRRGSTHRLSKADPTKLRLERRRRRYEQWLDEQRKKDADLLKLKQNPEHRLPEKEKRKSIDLRTNPVSVQKFSQLRLSLVIRFFIQQFLHMANTALNLRNYGQATMYVLQVENLCEIVVDEEGVNAFTGTELEEYGKETQRLRRNLGDDMKHYILARVTSAAPVAPAELNEPLSPTLSELNVSFPNMSNNWDMRKLPSPPPSNRDMRPTGRTLSRPNFTNSIRSLQKVPDFKEYPSPAEVSSSASPFLAPPAPRGSRSPRRQESIKFVSSLFEQSHQSQNSQQWPKTSHQRPHSPQKLPQNPQQWPKTAQQRPQNPQELQQHLQQLPQNSQLPVANRFGKSSRAPSGRGFNFSGGANDSTYW